MTHGIYWLHVACHSYDTLFLYSHSHKYWLVGLLSFSKNKMQSVVLFSLFPMHLLWFIYECIISFLHMWFFLSWKLPNVFFLRDWPKILCAFSNFNLLCSWCMVRQSAVVIWAGKRIAARMADPPSYVVIWYQTIHILVCESALMAAVYSVIIHLCYTHMQTVSL